MKRKPLDLFYSFLKVESVHCWRGIGVGFGGEDEFAAGGGDNGIDGKVDGFADIVARVGDDDHGAIGEVADGLSRIFSRFGELE